MSNNKAEISFRRTTASGQVLLTTAKELFWKWGIRKVSVEEICKHAGVSKMTFYRNFENKEELAFQVVDALMHEGEKQVEAIMNRQIDFSIKMRELISLKHEQSIGMSQEFLKDISANPESSLFKKLQLHHVDFEKKLMLHFRTAQEDGWIRKDLNLAFLLYMMRQSSTHLRDDSFYEFFPDPSLAIVELTKILVYGMQPIEEQA